MAGPYGLYTHIRSNKIKTVVALTIFPFLLPLLVFFVVASVTLPFGPTWRMLDQAAGYAFLTGIVAIPLAVIWVPIGYALSQWIIDRAVGAHGIQRNDHPIVWNLTENLCISRGLAVPTIRIIEADELNAFASGVSSKSHSITLTTALIAHLDKGELECVIAHELTHIINKDVNLLIATSIVAGVAPIACDIMLKAWLLFLGAMFLPFRLLEFIPGVAMMRVTNHAVSVLTAAVFRSLSALVSVLMTLFLSRRREYMADAGAIELTKNPESLITALQKISGNADLPSTITAVREMYFYSPPLVGLAGLLSTHPSISSRISAIQKYAQQFMPRDQQADSLTVTLPSIASVTTATAPLEQSPPLPPIQKLYDHREWGALRRSDPDINRLATKVGLLGEHWEDMFAAEYLAIKDKNYLPQIIRKIIEAANAERASTEQGNTSTEKPWSQKATLPDLRDVRPKRIEEKTSKTYVGTTLAVVTAMTCGLVGLYIFFGKESLVRIVTGSKGPASYTDVIAFCRAVINTDPAESSQSLGYVGQDPPSYLVAATDKQTLPSMEWRCRNGKFVACFGGASGRSCRRPSINNVASLDMERWCAKEWSSSFIPASLAGNSIYTWKCVSGKAVTGARSEVDERGYFRDTWQEIRP